MRGAQADGFGPAANRVVVKSSKAYGACQLIADVGRQVARARINKGTGGKFAQIERQSLALRSSAEPIPDLAAIYQRSVRRQLNPSRLDNEHEHAPVAA